MCREALGPAQQIILSPLLKIEMLPHQADVAAYHGLIFTSENGVRAFLQHQQASEMPAFCVGERTAKAARAAGFATQSANGSASDLITMINAADVSGPLLHVRGAHARGDIATGVTVQVDQVVAYQQSAQSLTDVAVLALRGDNEVILPLFSPRTAQIFCEQSDQITAPLHVIAMSAAVKDILSGSNLAKNGSIFVAGSPDAPSMLQAIKSRIGTN